MSLYRQAGGRWIGPVLLSTLAGFLTGGLLGYAIGRGSAPEPSLAELAAEARDELRPALNALELVTIEYPEAVQGGEVVAETEYEAAAAQARVAADKVAGAKKDLAELDPSAVEAVERGVDRVERLVESRAEPSTVRRAAAVAESRIEALAD